MSHEDGSVLETLRAELVMLRDRQRELERRLAEQEALNRATLAHVAMAEHQATRLTRLYVASLHLHGARETSQVMEAIQEIVGNLIGSEELAIFRMDESGRALSLVSSLGVEPERLRTVPLGQGPIGRAVQSGETFIAPTPLRAGEEAGDAVSACVPLRLEERVYGALAIFGLLPQKQELEDVDRELLALLADQAGPALQRAELLRHPAALS
ncbi:MAG TPA: GAF domain-containing protein [Archangium sp.]|uniref:GAF domain-containing protein n=1 Tax=Archangium sp. TaxID=1872627 RepID=UPI002E33F261|nr:GAF domain-containing protein [Archangium sp.]HEX5751316.1 GAF domain-containing protein [Archangium sp.]